MTKRPKFTHEDTEMIPVQEIPKTRRDYETIDRDRCSCAGDHLIIHGWKDKLIRMKTGDKYTGMVFQFISLDEEFQDGAKFTHWTTAHEIASKAVETDSCLQKRNSKIDQWLTFFI